MRGHAPYIDVTAPVYMVKVQYDNTDESAYVHFIPPDKNKLGWLGGCGNILCTGDYNVIVTDVTRGF